MAKTYAQVQTALGTWVTAYGTLLTKLDADAGVSAADYVATCALADPKEPNECRRKFNALCAKLDVDLATDDKDYAAKCGVSFQRDQHISLYDQVEALIRAKGALASKLNADLGVTDTNYAP